MTKLYEEKRFALDWVERNRARLSDFQMQIWSYHEPAWREYRSARAYCELLATEGFDVEEGSGGMPTAFCATWGEGAPVLGTFAEYDAVPGNSQQPVPFEAPRDGLNPWAPGHTDTHSMLGVATLTGVLAAKATMEKFKLPGCIRFFGEPAEKVCGSKPVHAAKGYYDGADAYVLYHPSDANTVLWDTHCGSYWSAVFTFECRHPERWAGRRVNPAAAVMSAASSHMSARCPGALDALCLMYTNTKYTKEAMFPHTGTWTLNEFVLVAGDATSDNLPPRLSQIQYSWRSPALEIQQQIYEVLENNARQAAAVTGCEASVRWVTKTRVGLPNHALSDLTWRNLELVGPPRYEESAREFCREIQRNLGLDPMENPIPETYERLTSPQAREASMRKLLPEWQLNFTSDDYVDYTWHAPASRLYTARPNLRRPDPGYGYPAWAYNAVGGRPELIDPGMFAAGKTVAATFIDLIKDPGEVAKARAEFEERTGGGVGGSKWVAPLLPTDFPPPIELRWPEYVHTVRGEDWWVPPPNPAAMQPL